MAEELKTKIARGCYFCKSTTFYFFRFIFGYKRAAHFAEMSEPRSKIVNDFWGVFCRLARQLKLEIKLNAPTKIGAFYNESPRYKRRDINR